VITGGNNDTSKSTSWKVLETALSHLKSNVYTLKSKDKKNENKVKLKIKNQIKLK